MGGWEEEEEEVRTGETAHFGDHAGLGHEVVEVEGAGHHLGGVGG